MNRLLFLLLFFPFLLQAQQEFTETMDTADGTRSYIVQLPSAYDGTTPLPLVFILHGIGSTAENMLNTGFGQLGNIENFIAVYPQGLEAPFSGPAWNNGTPLDLLGFTPDDVGFISSLINYMVLSYAADPSRVYSCGFSMGGIMSHRLACELSDKIAAIASQAGTMAIPIEASCSPTRAVPVLHMHGDADATVPYDGNTGLGLTSVDATIAKWKNINGCPDTPVSTNLPDTEADGITILKEEYSPCNENSEVELYIMQGAEHVWLGSQNDIATTLEFWNFFKQHSLDVSTPVQEIKEEISFIISPNPTNGIINIKGINKQMKARITDITGQLILSDVIENEMDISFLSQGVYFLRLEDKTGKSGMQRFVKM